MERYMILIRADGTGRLIRCDDGDTGRCIKLTLWGSC